MAPVFLKDRMFLFFSGCVTVLSSCRRLSYPSMHSSLDNETPVRIFTITTVLLLLSLMHNARSSGGDWGSGRGGDPKLLRFGFAAVEIFSLILVGFLCRRIWCAGCVPVASCPCKRVCGLNRPIDVFACGKPVYMHA